MPATGSSLSRWKSFGSPSVACVAAMAYPSWETIPFHLIWISLTVLYGFRVWSLPATSAVLVAVCLATGVSIMTDAFDGLQLWGELFEVPLMSAMFVAMVWHARRRKQAMETVASLAEDRAQLLGQQERLLQNVSHELRTPVTIARGHLELLERSVGEQPQLHVAFDELRRIEQIVDRLLLLGRAERDDFLMPEPVRLVPFMESVRVRPSCAAHGTSLDRRRDADGGRDGCVPRSTRSSTRCSTVDDCAYELSARGERDRVVISPPTRPGDRPPRIDLRALRPLDGAHSRESGARPGWRSSTRSRARRLGLRQSRESGTVFELRPAQRGVRADTTSRGGRRPAQRPGSCDRQTMNAWTALS